MCHHYTIRRERNTRKPGFEPDIPDRQCRITAWSRFPRPYLRTPCSWRIKRLQMFRNCRRSRTRTGVMGLPFGTHHVSPLHHTAYHICFIWIKAHAGAQPCLRYLVIRSWTIANLAPSVRSFKIRIPAAHSAFILSHSSLGLTLLPIPVPVAPCPTREHQDSELTLSLLVVLTDWVPSLPLRRLVGLFRCRFDSCSVQACALAAVPPQ